MLFSQIVEVMNQIFISYSDRGSGPVVLPETVIKILEDLDKGVEEEVTELDWDSIVWPSSLVKPKWIELPSLLMQERVGNLKSDLLTGLINQEELRITSAYIGDQDVPQNTVQELLYRIRVSAETLTEKNEERDRLHAKAKSIRAWLSDPARTIEELEKFDPTNDTNWAKD